MWIFIQPNDVWLFRTGQPFDAGSDHRAASIFPPNPTTIYGALCAAILTHLKIDFVAYRDREASEGDVDLAAELIGRLPKGELAAEAGKLRLSGPFLAKADPNSGQTIPYFPAPADLLKIDVDDQAKSKPLALLAPSRQEMITNWPNGKALRPLAPHKSGDGSRKQIDQGIESTSGKWLSAEAFDKYRHGQPMEQADLVSQKCLFHYENRLGIGLNNNGKISQDGLIYQTQFVRPTKGVGLLVRLTLADDGPIPKKAVPKKGWLALGGERKAAIYKQVDEPDFFKRSGSNTAGDRRKIVFLNDTKLDQGWTSSRWKSHQAGKLISAAVSGYRSIGGWDVAYNKQKPMSRFVPAGSVYYFEQATGQQPAFRQIIDDDSQAPFGYGYAIATGNW